jgi:hypothetical protein
MAFHAPRPLLRLTPPHLPCLHATWGNPPNPPDPAQPHQPNRPPSRLHNRPVPQVAQEMRSLILRLYDAYLSPDGKAVSYKGIGRDPLYVRYVSLTAELQKVRGHVCVRACVCVCGVGRQRACVAPLPPTRAGGLGPAVHAIVLMRFRVHGGAAGGWAGAAEPGSYKPHARLFAGACCGVRACMRASVGVALRPAHMLYAAAKLTPPPACMVDPWWTWHPPTTRHPTPALMLC